MVVVPRDGCVSYHNVYQVASTLDDPDRTERDTVKNGKKIDIEPDCSKLTDGITEDLDDDTVSKMYDDILLKLGFGDGQSPLTTTESSKEIADFQNPFKFGYLKAKPTRSQRYKAGFRRIGNALNRPFVSCCSIKISYDYAILYLCLFGFLLYFAFWANILCIFTIVKFDKNILLFGYNMFDHFFNYFSQWHKL